MKTLHSRSGQMPWIPRKLTMASPLRILGISGSLRKLSYNSAALRAAQELQPNDMSIESFDLTEIPLYSEDVRTHGYPPPVQAFRDKIASADGLLIVTPEYNYSFPGVLKNAIDWASRPPNQPFDGKPIAMMGASLGTFGTARAQYHLRQCFVSVNAFVLNKPEVMIAQAGDKFDEQGKLTDRMAREQIQRLLIALADWTRRLQTR